MAPRKKAVYQRKINHRSLQYVTDLKYEVPFYNELKRQFKKNKLKMQNYAHMTSLEQKQKKTTKRKNKQQKQKP